MTIEEAKQLYFTHLKRKGYTPRTIKERTYTLGTFMTYLIQKKVSTIEEITEKQIKNYISQRYYHMNQNGRQNTPETRNNEIEVIKNLFSFLTAKEYIETDPTEKIAYIKTPKYQIPKTILTKHELLKVFKQADTQTELGYRDRVCLELLYGTGLRRNELLNLNIEDIKIKEKLIHIRNGKGQKDRLVPVNETALHYIEHYIKYIRNTIKKTKKKKITTASLLINKDGGRLKAVVLRKRIKECISKAKLTKEITLHSFRHTFATHLIQKGMPVRHVQELLGHRQLETTIQYLQLSINELQREYRRSHPREKSV